MQNTGIVNIILNNKVSFKRYLLLVAKIKFLLFDENMFSITKIKLDKIPI